MKRALASLFLLPCLIAGCGDDGASPPPPPSDGGSPPPADAGGAADGGVDGGAPLMDSGNRSDAGPPSCMPGAPGEIFRDPDGRTVDFAMAGGTDSFLLVWTALVDGNQNVFSRLVGADGSMGDQTPLTDDPALVRMPAVTWTGTQWLVVYSTSETGGINDFELHARTVGADGTPGPLAVPVTANALEDRGPRLLSRPSNVLATWLQVDSGAGTDGVVMTQLLDSTTGQAVGAPTPLTEEGDAPAAPRIGHLGMGTAVAAWTANLDTGHDVWIRPLDTNGAAAGAAMGLSSGSNALGGLELSDDGEGGLALFEVIVGTRFEVHARPYAADGTPRGMERSLSVNVPGRSPSVTPLAGGHVALYRTTDPLRLQVRIAVLDPDGRLLDARQLASVESDSGQVVVDTNRQGSLLGTFLDTDGAAVLIRSQGIVCAP